MNREVHVRICGGRRVKLPPPTRRHRWAAAGPGCGRMTGRGPARPMDLDELVEHWTLFDDEQELLAVERVRREARRTRTRRARGRRRPCPGCIRGVRRPAPGRR